MKSDHIVMLFTVGIKSLVTIAALYYAYCLLTAGKDGWGWFLFASVCFGSYSLKLD